MLTHGKKLHRKWIYDKIFLDKQVELISLANTEWK